jgi:hypothetical protein
MALQRAEASLKRCERRIGVLRGKTLRRQALDRKQLTGNVLLRSAICLVACARCVRSIRSLGNMSPMPPIIPDASPFDYNLTFK